MLIAVPPLETTCSKLPEINVFKVVLPEETMITMDMVSSPRALAGSAFLDDAFKPLALSMSKTWCFRPRSHLPSWPDLACVRPILAIVVLLEHASRRTQEAFRPFPQHRLSGHVEGKGGPFPAGEDA